MSSAGYIEQFLTSFGGDGAKGPGIAKISLPTGDVISGILASEVNISMQNRFGPLIPDISFLTDISSMVGSTSLLAWIGSTAQAWKGTEPIRFGMDLYFVNYKPNLNLEGKLKALARMCSLEATGSATVQAHGGYQGRYFGNNLSQQYFNNAENYRAFMQEKDPTAQEKYDYLKGVGGEFQKEIFGVVAVEIGSRFRLDNLLILRVDITPSLTEIYNAGSPKPLYYKVGLSFQTCRAALATDVEGML